MKEHIDVTIYVSNIRAFLDKNTDAAKYFFGNMGQDLFYEVVTIFATQNYEERGDPALTMEQFEEIRHAIIAKFGVASISNKEYPFPFSLN